VDGRVPLKTPNPWKTSTVYLRINFDYTQRSFVLEYITVLDVIALIGGSFAFFLPIMALGVPFVFMHYIYQLAKIIRDEYQEMYKQSLTLLLKVLVGKIKTRRKFDSKYDEINQLCNNAFYRMRRWVTVLEDQLRTHIKKSGKMTQVKLDVEDEDDLGIESQVLEGIED